MVGPSGVWLFETRNWNREIVRQDGTWKQVRSRRETVPCADAPDDTWLARKKVVESYLPERVAGTGSLVQGGVVFTHPKVRLEKTHVIGNTASYGQAKAWLERIQAAPDADGFTLDDHLSLLDALAGEYPAGERISAQEEAERLYQVAAEELRAYVAKMVGEEGEKPKKK